MAPLSTGDIAFDLTLEETQEVPLQRVTAFLYDFGLLYDLSVIVTRPRYAGYQFNQSFWRRNGRPLSEDEQLVLRSLDYGSPLRIRTGIAYAVAVSGVLWTLTQSIDRIAMLGSSRELVQAQAAEAMANARVANAQAEVIEADFPRSVEELADRHSPEARRALDSLVSRIRSQRVQLDALQVYTIVKPR